MSMTLQGRLWFHCHRVRASITAALLGAMLAGASGAFGAELVPLSGSWSAICRSERDSTLIRCENGAVVATRALAGRMDCAADGPERNIIVFRQRRALYISNSGDEVVVRIFPWEVRSCLKLDDTRYLLLVGGRVRSAILWGTHAVLWDTATGKINPAPYVRPEWNSSAMTAGPPAGPGDRWVMVSVRKQAPFDAAWRVRPFLFQYCCGDGRFLPLWKGTSFSRPYRGVGFANWLRTPDDVEIAVIEDVGQGVHALTAYLFDGGMTMSRASVPMRLGSRVESALVGKKLLPVVFVRNGAGGRLVAFDEGNKMMLPGVSQIVPRLQTQSLAKVPLAWTILPSQPRPSALVLTSETKLRLLPLTEIFGVGNGNRL